MTTQDWLVVFTNAPWILGCAIALALLSYANWRATEYHEKLRAQFARPKIRAAFDFSLVLFCIGMAATSGSALALIIWLILTILIIIQFIVDLRTLRSTKTL